MLTTLNCEKGLPVVAMVTTWFDNIERRGRQQSTSWLDVVVYVYLQKKMKGKNIKDLYLQLKI
jgi:hypothetical protein